MIMTMATVMMNIKTMMKTMTLMMKMRRREKGGRLFFVGEVV